MYLDLQAYQHHVFMDWRFVDDEKWREIYVSLNGAGVESMSAKWEEMFGVKEEVVVEEVKVKKPRRKAAARKPAAKKSTVKVTGPKRNKTAKTTARKPGKKPVKKSSSE
jgi:hypothetical protein